MSRRLAAAVAVALLAGGCSDSDEAGLPGRRPGPAPPPTTTNRLEPAVRYQPLPDEPEPLAKQLASDVVQALSSYDAAVDPAPSVAVVVARLGAPASLVEQTRPLLVGGAASAGDIVYPQLGGLTSRSASVMVILRQRLLESGKERATTRTIDVRLARGPAGWYVTAVDSVGGEEVPLAPSPSPEAAQVLSNANLDLPDSARWDIAAGRVDARILALLATLGKDHRLGVTVLAAGHPHNVFGSSSVSNHTRGRAVDVWAVDGRAVVEQRDPSGALADLGRRLLADGVTELGGPWDLDGPGGASFTNTVHQDHVHVGFDAP